MLVHEQSSCVQHHSSSRRSAAVRAERLLKDTAWGLATAMETAAAMERGGGLKAAAAMESSGALEVVVAERGDAAGLLEGWRACRTEEGGVA